MKLIHKKLYEGEIKNFTLENIYAWLKYKDLSAMKIDEFSIKDKLETTYYHVEDTTLLYSKFYVKNDENKMTCRIDAIGPTETQTIGKIEKILDEIAERS